MDTWCDAGTRKGVKAVIPLGGAGAHHKTFGHRMSDGVTSPREATLHRAGTCTCT